MTLNRQSSQPESIQGLASRQELREAFCSASAKYRREPRRSAQKAGGMAIKVTCHLCHYTFEHQVLRQVEAVFCPSCGVHFELKQQYQVDSVQIEQIEQELFRLRAEIEAHNPQRHANRENSVIGPLPMQTLKMNIDGQDKQTVENQSKKHGSDLPAYRVHSSLVRLEKDQLNDYLQWRNSLRREKKLNRTPDHPPTGKEQSETTNNSEHSTNEYQTCHHTTTGVVGRSSFADDLERLNRSKTKFRIKTAVAGIILCSVLCVAIFAMGFFGSGNRSQLESREMYAETEELKPTQTMDVLQSKENSKPHDSSVTENILALADTSSDPSSSIVQVAVPNLITPTFIPESPLPLPPVDFEAEYETDMLALDRQLHQTQTQLSHVTHQYELTRQNNEQLERMAKQNEAESLLWEAYSNTGKSPVRSMVLSLQAIERFKELELDVPNNARWVLNQSLASQNLGIPFNGFQGGVDAMTLSKDGQWFLFAGNDGIVWLWDVSKHDQMSKGFQVDTINGGVSQLRLLITSTVRYGFCVGRNGAIRIWNLKLEKPSKEPLDIVDTRCNFTNVAVSEDGHWLAAYGKPGRYDTNKEINDVYLWDLKHLNRNGALGTPIVLKGHQKPIRSLAISNNSKWLVSGSEDQTVRVYDLKASYPAAEQIVLKGHELAVNCVTISPDGRWLVTGGGDSIVRIWDMQSRQSMAKPIPLQEHEGWITTQAFSPDGKWLATGSYDNTIRIWRMDEAKQPEVVKVLSGHTGLIKSVEFSRQGNMLVSVGSDREVRLWNLEQGNPSENVLTFHSGPVPISSATMTGDGKWLIMAQQKPNAVTSSGLRLWPLVFDETFQFAAGFAESRFPAMYKRRQNSMSPILEQQEERIARTGNFTQAGTQFPVIPTFEPSNHVPQSGSSVPPFSNQFNLAQPDINITISPPR